MCYACAWEFEKAQFARLEAHCRKLTQAYRDMVAVRELCARIEDSAGNCYAACIASITGLPFDVLRMDPPPTPDDDKAKRIAFNNRMVNLLHDNGWALCRMGTRIPAGLAIAVGPSPRGNWDHAVVTRGREWVHDPHPSGVFLPSVRYYEVLVKIDGLIEDPNG